MCDRIMDTDSLRPFIGLRRAEKPDQKQAEIEAQDQEQGNGQGMFHTRFLRADARPRGGYGSGDGVSLAG